MKNNDNLNNRNEPLNNTNNDNYPTFNNNLPNNHQIIEINRHQDLMMMLRQIVDNTSNQRRRNEEGDSVSFCIVFLVGLFLIYMGISFYRVGGFATVVGPKLFFMIIALFLAIALLHREEQKNVITNINKRRFN